MRCASFVLILLGGLTPLYADTTHDPFSDLSDPVYKFLRDVVQHLRTSSNSSECRDDFDAALRNAEAGNEHTLQLFDSMGKPGSAILDGGVSYVGTYSECIAAQVGYNSSGKYCLVNFKFNTNKIEQNVSFWLSFNSKMKIGICVPSTCPQNDIQSATDAAAWNLHPDIKSVLFMCHSSKDDQPIEWTSWFVISLFAFIVLLGIFGSILDALASSSSDLKDQTRVDGQVNQTIPKMTTDGQSLEINNSSSETLYKSKKIEQHRSISDFVRAFSLFWNIRQILNTDSAEGTIQAIHGIRFLSMAWIITGHSFSFANKWLLIRSSSALNHVESDFISLGIANGTFAVDTFFLLGGFLMAYIILRRTKRSSGDFNILTLYLHRYIRMTPLMMAVIAFTANILRYMGSGPMWPDSILMYDGWCRENWWLNLLYVQNFFNTESMCLSHTWYSAIDMQFFLIAPIIMKLCLWHTFGAIAAIAGLFIVTALIPFILTLLYHLPAVPNSVVPLDLVNFYYKICYIKPYCRMGPYLVGIALAYYLYRKDFAVRISKKFLPVGWTLAIVINLVVIYSMGRTYTPNPPSDAEAAFYNGFARSAWAATIAWLILTCMSGQAGILNSILSFPALIPLSRLTYSAYLIHPVLMALSYGTKEQMYDFSVYFMIYQILANLTVTYLVSLILSALFEYPITNIEKLYRNR